jgi:hypothetical protein
MNTPPPFAVEHRLAGWRLAWTRLAVLPCDEGRVAALRAAAAGRCRAERSLETLSSLPTVAAVRRLFRDAGDVERELAAALAIAPLAEASEIFVSP